MYGLMFLILFLLTGCISDETASVLVDTAVIAYELDHKDDGKEEPVESGIKPPTEQPKPEVKPDSKPEYSKAVTVKPKSNGQVVEAPVENRPGRANGNRQHFFFGKPKSKYPNFTLYYGNKSVAINNAKPRVGFKNGGLVKQSDTRSGMAILLPSSEPQYDTVYIRYRRK